LYEITAHNSFVLCLAELGLLGSTLWMALLVTTTTGLNRILGAQKKRQASRFLGLRRLFEECSIYSAGALAINHAPSEGIIGLKYAYACEALSPMANANATEFGPGNEAERLPIVPQQWVATMRLALVSFMTTAWFLSRCYTTTMYLVLGLATATIAIQGSNRKWPDRGRWISSTLTAEILLILLIYGLVRLRH
jgi:hypothetical protein